MSDSVRRNCSGGCDCLRFCGGSAKGILPDQNQHAGKQVVTNTAAIKAEIDFFMFTSFVDISSLLKRKAAIVYGFSPQEVKELVYTVWKR